MCGGIFRATKGVQRPIQEFWKIKLHFYEEFVEHEYELIGAVIYRK
jgi:hypothetical protein